MLAEEDKNAEEKEDGAWYKRKYNNPGNHWKMIYYIYELYELKSLSLNNYF